MTIGLNTVLALVLLPALPVLEAVCLAAIVAPTEIALIEAMLVSLSRGERVAVLSEHAEVTPNEAATILGISRPLVVHRMEIGDLPFRYVGKHRRARLTDVLALKAQLDPQREALRALAAMASRQVRVALLKMSCAVSDQPDVCECVRNDSERWSFGLNSSLMSFAQSRRAARILAISMK